MDKFKEGKPIKSVEREAIEPSLLKLVASVADVAEVAIDVETRPLATPMTWQMCSLRYRSPTRQGANIFFHYIFPPIAGKLEVANLDQRYVTEQDTLIINDVLYLNDDGTLYRQRQSDSTQPSFHQSRERRRPASARTVLAMARLAASQIKESTQES